MTTARLAAICRHRSAHSTFTKRLNEIRGRFNVHNVLVQINEVVEEDSTTWPFSESVYIFTNATHDEVAQWAAALQPDAVEEGFANGRPSRVKDLPSDIKTYRL
jgi:hypothetical protein